MLFQLKCCCQDVGLHELFLFTSGFRFDLANTNVNDDNLDKMSADRIPDVVLVKKVYAGKALRNRKRKWKLKHIDGLHDNLETGSVTSTNGGEYADFLADLEEDAELRKNVNVYKDARKMVAVDEQSEAGDLGIPQITLAEMLDDLAIGSSEDGGAAASSIEAEDMNE